MGPWSRSFVAASAGRGGRPDPEVGALRIDPGTIWAVVEGCEVTLTAPVIPSRIWAQMVRYAKGMGQLEQAVAGKVQSVHLEHLLEEDWGELMIPRASSIKQACTCDEGGGCEHAIAVACAFADERGGTVSPATRAKLAEKPDEKVEFLHAIYPRVGPAGKRSKNRPFASCHIEVKTQTPVLAAGFEEFPWAGPRGNRIVPRHNHWAGDVQRIHLPDRDAFGPLRAQEGADQCIHHVHCADRTRLRTAGNRKFPGHRPRPDPAGCHAHPQ